MNFPKERKPGLAMRISALAYKRLDITITRRGELAALIQRCATAEGTIWVSESGRDCDGIRYQCYRLREITATVRSYRREVEVMEKWADGPCSMQIHHPDTINNLEYQSRDLVMEAFEDGHAHCLYV